MLFEWLPPQTQDLLRLFLLRKVSDAYDFDVLRHHRAHIHATFQGEEAVIAIPDGELLEGSLPPGKLKMVLAWVEGRKKVSGVIV